MTILHAWTPLYHSSNSINTAHVPLYTLSFVWSLTTTTIIVTVTAHKSRNRMAERAVSPATTGEPVIEFSISREGESNLLDYTIQALMREYNG